MSGILLAEAEKPYKRTGVALKQECEGLKTKRWESKQRTINVKDYGSSCGNIDENLDIRVVVSAEASTVDRL